MLRGRPEAILAFESSCDETAVAAVSESGKIIAEALSSQIETHNKYGGVVPEVASRSHFEVINALAQKVMAECRNQNISFKAIAATQGPGLIGPLLVGSSYAQGIATGLKIPFIGVHHLRGHLASALLSDTPDDEVHLLLKERAAKSFPALVLLVSGGHTQILSVDSQLRARKLIDTVDDAAGECFDKSAKLMGMPYPGGPAIEAQAKLMNPTQHERAQSLNVALPRPKTESGAFSFSGLKTAIRNKVEKDPSLKKNPEFCWAIQEAISDSLILGLSRSLDRCRKHGIHPGKTLIFCGGVSANKRLRAAFLDWAAKNELQAVFPPLKYCTDNAAMIAAAAWVQAPELAMHSTIARQSLEIGSAMTDG